MSKKKPKLPKKYLTTNPRVMRREIEKHGGKRDDDPSAYGPWDADYKSRKAGKGKRVETKPSKYTKKYKEMFGEGKNYDSNNNIIRFEEFNHQKIDDGKQKILDKVESSEDSSN